MQSKQTVKEDIYAKDMVNDGAPRLFCYSTLYCYFRAGVDAAGGIKETGAYAYLNQAEKLSDGQKIYVPSQEEALAQGGDGQSTEELSDGRINLNTASKEELMTLSGIGEVKAEAILRYREEKGGFTSVEELKGIEGIKEFNKVKDQIKL